ncbi:delta-12-fatty acid desaturase [Ephemerocybe angulata]|uniref:Delta-12-fatty acid desaturase n=1 Tax=Ephemerocybe angulata TaxID=980116 RepID=A0A8H6HD41_9AGAR|nr:delta-12-fatty acid desaturase [Tulosesus angulatus]
MLTMLSFWGNGPEYETRLQRLFRPPSATLKEVHDAVPKELLERNQLKSLSYLLRDIVLAAFLYSCASRITPWSDLLLGNQEILKICLKTCLWCTYWVLQSLVGAGIFCIGHDAGHGSLFASKTLNNLVGFLCHSYLILPYFSWRSTHHAHHKATGSMERDENYVPYSRSKFNLPHESKATAFDYAEVFEETPLYTLFRMLIMQAFGWWIYLSRNTMGCPSHPPGTSHFNPYSPLFKPEQRMSIILSNIGLGSMIFILYCAGCEFALWYYLPPFLLVNHWIVMFTYLHHSDPTIPHYRKGEWTFFRGAAATVDRPLLGWFGRFFFHNISHDHVAHHFFLRAPFYNGPQITSRIKAVLGEDYNYDSTPSFYALYRSFTQCLFVKEDGDIVFYKNRKGEAARVVDPEFLKKIS